MLKAAVIGCGRMGAEPSARLEGKAPPGWIPVSHVESFLAAKGIELVALADNNAERLNWVGRHYGVGSLYEDYRQLLAEVRPDIIGIATRTPQKSAILKEACRAGVKGAYVEKPLSNSLREAEEILAEARRAKMVVSYGVNRRYHTVYRQARDLIAAGEIGDLLEVVVEFGEAQLLWTHPHSVDLMLFLSNQRPFEVQAEMVADSVKKTSPTQIDSDPLISFARFWFEGGARGVILRGGGSGVRAHGTRGTLEVASDGAALILRKASGGQQTYFLSQSVQLPVSSRSATVVAMEELAANVNGQPTKSISADEIYGGMQMLWGCVYSHLQGGQRCRLEDVPKDICISGRTGNLFA